MNMDTNQNPFYQNLNEIYKEREKLFRQRIYIVFLFPFFPFLFIKQISRKYP